MPPTRRNGLQPRRRTRGEGGAVTAELVVALPVLLLLLLGIVQFALWQHAAHIATAAADEGLTTTEVQTGSTAAGTAAVTAVLTQLGHGLLTNPQVQVSRGPETAQITIRASTEAVLPFLHLPVHATVTGPVERFRDAMDQP